MNTIFHVSITKVNKLLTFDWTKLPEQSKNYVAQYGFNKSVNDANASTKREDFDSQSAYEAEVLKVSMVRVNQILTGQPPKSAIVSPVLVAGAKLGLTEEQMIAALEAAAKRPGVAKSA